MLPRVRVKWGVSNVQAASQISILLSFSLPLIGKPFVRQNRSDMIGYTQAVIYNKELTK